MTIAIRRPGMIAALLFGAACAASFTSAAHAQDTEPPTFLDKQLARLDLGITGVGEFSKTTNGPNYLNQTVTLKPSNTLGYMGTVGYSKSPWVGGEFNFQNIRYTDNFTLANTATTPANQNSQNIAIQTNVIELSAGYLIRPAHTFYGIQPYASAGLGAMDFRPTPGGGQGLPHEGVRSFYYTVGGEELVTTHFGLRGGIRQTFYLQPDFFQNFLRNSNHSYTIQPYAGFFIRF
ncbi:porin family protein [Granulicella tundricola]|uniref:Outer membrane protein beta-barrel domain-containing protein n=1 Tax=Granulicella tundricola (strain ATCC BAA-1859 / DSM 23138 / MP5ACTX9) TaxID=1198114 RepID=E8WYC9_GRATM|nr:outer membrane beta-barrel protein [Granulicella tundricola]ADW69835.1 hypothetical protein AciX9_2812 [Granulicella tundricola MP5ACTX9]